MFVDEFWLLGVTIDEKLSFDSHIYNIVAKVNSKTFILLKNLESVPFDFRVYLFT